MKLGNKIHAYTTALFIVLLILISGSVYFSFSKIVYDSDLEQTRLEAERIVSSINGQQLAEVRIEDLLRAYVPANGMIRVIREGGQTTSVVEGNNQYLADQNYRFSREEQAEVHSYGNTPHAVISIPIIWIDGEVASLKLIQSLEATAENLDILQLVLILVTILAITPLFLSARVLSKLITNPITSLIQTMQQIRRSGRFKKIEAKSRSKDELNQMANTFNHLMDQLEENYRKQEQFVSNASHELKTPLTVIESYSNLLKRRGRQDEGLFEESVEAIHSEAKRMRELTQQLLLLAKQEEHWKVDLSIVSVLSIFQSIVSSFEKAYQRKVNLQADENFELVTDEQKLKQLLYIFMDNARKYSDHSINVEIEKKETEVIIRIIDQGIGMSSEDLEKVYDRFYQADQSRAEGYGLGLSLAKELAKAIGAEIQLESEEGQGTTAFIYLPISQ